MGKHTKPRARKAGGLKFRSSVIYIDSFGDLTNYEEICYRQVPIVLCDGMVLCRQTRKFGTIYADVRVKDGLRIRMYTKGNKGGSEYVGGFKSSPEAAYHDCFYHHENYRKTTVGHDYCPITDAIIQKAIKDRIKGGNSRSKFEPCL